MTNVAIEEPFASVVADEHLNTLCSACFSDKANVSRCVGCNVVRYCNKACQRKDWIDHKHECPLMKNYYPNVAPMTCRLIARIVMKLKRADGQEPAFNGRIWDDLMDHRDEMEKDPERMKIFVYYSHVLRAYMGEKLVPDRDVLFSIFGKMATNAFGTVDERYFSGQALYLGLSAHDHSCIPDVHLIFNGNKATLRSPDPKKKYSKDLKVTYTDLLFTNRIRQQKLQEGYYFKCTCARCSDPTLDFLYNSARSTCCSDSYCLLDPDAKELKCNKCGSVSGITVKEALAANEGITEFQAMNPQQSTTSTDRVRDIKNCIEVYEKFSKVLSPMNLNLLLLNDRLVRKAFFVDNSHPACKKYGENLLPVYKQYLTVGSLELTEQLKGVSLFMSHVHPPSKKVLELLQETVAAYSVSHGREHNQTAFFSFMLTDYRERLQDYRKGRR